MKTIKIINERNQKIRRRQIIKIIETLVVCILFLAWGLTASYLYYNSEIERLHQENKRIYGLWIKQFSKHFVLKQGK